MYYDFFREYERKKFEILANNRGAHSDYRALFFILF